MAQLISFFLVAGLAALPAEDTFAPTRVVAGRTLVMIGVGEKKDDYAMALYVDEIDARRAFPALAARAGGRSRSRLLAADHSQTFVVWGHFTKVAVLRMSKDVSGDTLRGWFQAGIPDFKAETFFDLFNRDLKKGAELVLRTFDDGRIEVELDGEKKEGPQNAKLARSLWKMWLADKPPVPELRRALVERIEVLGR
jgi:hypothetical protein